MHQPHRGTYTLVGADGKFNTSDDVINVGEIDVYSPVQNITEESSAISVLASAPDYVNSRIQIYLNEMLVKE